MALWILAGLIAACHICQGSETQFSVNDDLFAFPQYEVVFSESYIPVDQALDKLDVQFGWNWDEKTPETENGLLKQPQAFQSYQDYFPDEEYHVLQKNGRAYFCTIPIVKPVAINETKEKPSPEENEKELARAVDKGRELLQGMQSNQCLFYSTGWWTYSFCYNAQVRQFHALPPSAGAGRTWPPQEDPTTPAYVLGKVDGKKSSAAQEASTSTDLAELQTKAETHYLVQRLDGGTTCDLTGKARNVEIEFHCNPQITDRIGWIKETSTCSYLMIIYTPRLCNDVAFLPPKEAKTHTISCQEMLTESDIPEWEARKKGEGSRKMIGESDGRIMVGDLEVGARKYLGKDGKIERGRIVLTQEEKAETIIQQKDGQIRSMAKADMKKLDLNPEEVEVFTKELQKLAGSKDWKIELLDDPAGVQLRGIVSADEKDGEKTVEEKVAKGQKQAVAEEEEIDGNEGSEEEYKKEI